MRKPVRSTVANRKYFQGGGLAPMKPAAPEEAVGIMASSQPLVDMIAQSAGNPQGGMSPLNFDQGGLANVPVPQGVPKSRIRRFGDFVGDFAMSVNPFRTFQSINPLRTVLDEKTGPALGGIARYFADVPTDPRLKQFGIDQLSVTELVKKRFPGKEAEVEEIARNIVSETPGIKPKTLGEQITKQLSVTTAETDGEKLLKETEKSKDKLKPFLRDPKGGVIKDEEGIEEGLKAKEIPEEDREKIKEKGGELAKSLLEKEQEQAKKDAEEQAKKDATVREQDAVTKLIDEAEGDEPSKTEDETVSEETNIINQNVADDQKTSEDRLGMLMKRFTDAAPKYEGLDTGLALMQMGALIAGGTSPNAVKNIADALTVTSEKLIKDKSKRDAFNRQVQLSALQYGLGEISKDEAQLRADKRKFTNFVVAEGAKPITWKGETYKPGETIRVSDEDYFNAGSKLPPGLQDASIYTANASAIAARANATNKFNNKLFEMKIIKGPERETFQKNYKTAVEGAASAETTASLIESVILRADKVVGGEATAKTAGASLLAVLGIDAPKGWNEKKLSITDLKAALQGVVKVTLGKTQSANSISNRDVDLLIQGFLADGIISENKKDGTYNFALTATPKAVFVKSLQNGLREVRRAQAGFLNDMTQIERDLIGRYTPQLGEGSDVIAQYAKQKETAGFGTTLKEDIAKDFKPPYVLKDGIYEPV